MDDTLRGNCFCGACQFELVGKPLFSSYCHCTICQRLSGAPYVHCLGFPTESVKITAGESNMNEVKSSDSMTRYFCKTCNAPVYNQSHIQNYEFRDVCASMLERDLNGQLVHMGHADMRPKFHSFYSMRIMDVADNLPKYDGFPADVAIPDKWSHQKEIASRNHEAARLLYA